jgi:hypothetical protein
MDSAFEKSPEQVAEENELDRITGLVEKAQRIFSLSTAYIEANITTTWERNLAHFNSEHAPGSKISQRNYKRSRTFRPKTRSSIKAAEAALTTAAFSTLDLVDISPEDPRDEAQSISAVINKNILQYRLDRRMPWFQTCIGAYQCTKVYGLTISHNYWRYRQDVKYELALNESGQAITDEDGNLMGIKKPIVRDDRLCCDLVAPENFRFSAMCDWRDPVGTSPFLIYIMPIYAGDALEMMQNENPKTGEAPWFKHSLDSLLSTRRKLYDRTRQAREGDRRIDPAVDSAGDTFTMLWAHMNIVKMNGQDMVYWTMGDQLLLTNPVAVAVEYPHLEDGERPFTIGFSSIEAFRNYPAGDVEQGASLQAEINEVANQRLDNVKLVLNKRYYVRRGSQVDLDALVRNVPGGGVMMNDPEKDVKTVDTRDVTQSSYQEQGALMTEFDDLVGNFSQTSAKGSGNEKEKGTKGGQQQMGGIANVMSDYSLRIFFETWMEPTLRQLVKLIQYYETDDVILSMAARNSDLWVRYGVDKPTDDLIRKDLLVRINVGMGNTDPMRKVERLSLGVKSVIELPGMARRIKSSKIADEFFGTLGFRDSSKFFRIDEEQEAYDKENPPQPPIEMKLKQEELAIRREDNQFREKRETEKLAMEERIAMAGLALKEGISVAELENRLQVTDKQEETKRGIADQKDLSTRESADQSDITARDSADQKTDFGDRQEQTKRDIAALSSNDAANVALLSAAETASKPKPSAAKSA